MSQPSPSSLDTALTALTALLRSGELNEHADLFNDVLALRERLREREIAEISDAVAALKFRGGP